MTFQLMIIGVLVGLAAAYLVRSILKACRSEGCAACPCKGCPSRREASPVKARRP